MGEHFTVDYGCQTEVAPCKLHAAKTDVFILCFILIGVRIMREREREVYLPSDGTYTIIWTDRSSKMVHGKVHWNKHFN